MDLIAEGFDPGAGSDRLFVHDRDAGYVPLTVALHDRIVSGDLRL